VPSLDRADSGATASQRLIARDDLPRPWQSSAPGAGPADRARPPGALLSMRIDPRSGRPGCRARVLHDGARTSTEEIMVRGVGGKSPSNLQTYLKGASYPATRHDLLETARRNGAPSEVIRVIEALKDGSFGGPQEVMKRYSAGRR
jgi:hypothetical protein